MGDLCQKRPNLVDYIRSGLGLEIELGWELEWNLKKDTAFT